MSNPLRDQLQASLGSAYRLERELGGGGMARVFVAEETSLGRTVVVKVLPPELAASMSAERFAREIRVAAQLQDPHIVPVLSAGSAGELPYYTMPYVAGESLRERMGATPALTVLESVEVLRGMLLAIAAAHDAGVVHRDIKPENVLLTRAGTPVVTDFGIAKAVADARTVDGGEHATEGLTQHGMSIGTPAYMSPEQAAGGDVTPRADLYAWGMVAYELLAGGHPFAAKTNAQQLIAAQLMERPAPLFPRAHGVPKVLAELVEQCLSKAPGDRPAGARDVLRALDIATGRNTPVTGTPQGSSRRHAAVIGGLLALIIAVVAGIAGARARSAASLRLSPARVVVLPFDNRSGDTAVASLGAMAADWIVRGITETGLVDVESPPSSGSSDAARIAAARTAGAGTLLTGAVYRTADSVRIVATMTDVNDGRVIASLPPVTAPASNPMPALETLRRRVAGALAPRVDPSFDIDRLGETPPSFEAYRAVLAARDAGRRYTDAGELYRRAESIDTGYATPVFGEIGVRGSLREFARRDSLIAWLEQRRARLTPYEAADLDANETNRSGSWEQYIASVRRQAALAPHSAALQARLARALLGANHVGEAMSILDKVDTSRIVSTSIFWFDHAYAAHRLGDFTRELSLVDAALRRSPRNPDLLGSRVRVLAALGRMTDVRAILDSAGRTGDGSLIVSVYPTAIAELMAHGRLADGRAVAVEMLRLPMSNELSIGDFPRGPDLRRAASLAMIGQIPEALHIADSLVASLAADPNERLVPGLRNDLVVWPVALRGAILARGHDTAGADKVARQLEALRPIERALASALVGRAAIAAQLGRGDEAVALLRAAIDAHATFAFTVPWGMIILNAGITPESPWFAPLRGYAPFEQLMRPIG